MRSLLRDLKRQRLRSALTISGVALGIFTLVVLGALGEHFRAIANDARRYTRGQIRLFTKTNQAGHNPGITPETLAAIQALPEVRVIRPNLVNWLDGFNLEANPMSFMTPKPLVLGLDAEHAQALRPNLELLRGRWIQKGDTQSAMMVSWLVKRRGFKLGDTVVIRHQQYQLVGVYKAPDVPLVPAGIVPYKTLNGFYITPRTKRAQAFFKGMTKELGNDPELAGLSRFLNSNPMGQRLSQKLAKRFVEKQENLYRFHDVIPQDPSDQATAALAQKLRKIYPQLAVIDPDQVAEQMEQAISMFVLLTSIVTSISTVIGGLLIINTMAMAVLERRREIAIKAAIGATPWQIISEFLLEAGAIGLIGAALGIGLGVLSITLAEPSLLLAMTTGERLFLITPRLLILASSYGVGMGLLAGAIPAIRAANIDPAITLREL